MGGGGGGRGKSLRLIIQEEEREKEKYLTTPREIISAGNEPMSGQR